MENISYNDLPNAVILVFKKLLEIEQTINEKLASDKGQNDQWFDVEGFSNYHPDKPSTATIYKWVQEKKVPHHKGGKRLRFLKSEIDNFLMDGKRRTKSEIQSSASTYVKIKGV